MHRLPELIVILALGLAGLCLYYGITGQIDAAETIITTAASLFIAALAAIESKNLRG